jgi:hypothetical protein
MIAKLLAGLLLTASLLACGCKPQFAASSPKWEYEEFEFHEVAGDSESGKWRTSTVSFVDAGIGKLPDQPKSQEYHSLSGVLDYVGGDGWELVLFDGKNYVTKRIKGTGTHAGFSVSFDEKDSAK